MIEFILVIILVLTGIANVVLSAISVYMNYLQLQIIAESDQELGDKIQFLENQIIGGRR